MPNKVVVLRYNESLSKFCIRKVSLVIPFSIWGNSYTALRLCVVLMHAKKSLRCLLQNICLPAEVIENCYVRRGKWEHRVISCDEVWHMLRDREQNWGFWDTGPSCTRTCAYLPKEGFFLTYPSVFPPFGCLGEILNKWILSLQLNNLFSVPALIKVYLVLSHHRISSW